MNKKNNLFYILVDKEPVPIECAKRWGEWWQKKENRNVAKTKLGSEVLVSTVFLGIDHCFTSSDDDDIKPILFETLVIGGPNNEYMERYCTYQEAEEGHARIVRMCEGEVIKLFE